MSMFGLTPYKSNTMTNWFDDFDREFFNFPMISNASAFRTDILDKGDHYLLEAELPGFEKEDIHIDLNEGYLTISAKHEENKEEKKHNYVRRERVYGSYARSFDVSGVDVENIDAEYKHGVLELKLPKMAEKKPETKRISVR